MELLRLNPSLAAVLLAATGIEVPPDLVATPTDGDLTACLPTELRADALTILHNRQHKLAVITESQSRPPTRAKRRAWAAYVGLAQSENDCDVVLIIIARDRATARACATVIRTGHPGYDLRPFVIGPDTIPDPTDPANAAVAPELTVLAAIAHTLDLDSDATRRAVMRTFADLDPERRSTYTRLVYFAASPAARRALEDLMAITWPRMEFFDKFIAEGEARILLRLLAARGFTIPDTIRERVVNTSDTEQIERWSDRVLTAESLEMVFTD